MVESKECIMELMVSNKRIQGHNLILIKEIRTQQMSEREKIPRSSRTGFQGFKEAKLLEQAMDMEW